MAAPVDNTFTNNSFTGYTGTCLNTMYSHPSQPAVPLHSNSFVPQPSVQQIAHGNRRVPAPHGYVPQPSPQQIAHMNQSYQLDPYPKPQPQLKTGNASPSEHSTILPKGTSLSLMGGMQKIWESGEYSDLTIQCEDQKFLVHKAVVLSQSKVLAAAMNNGFKESELSIIDLSDDGVLLVSCLVKFLYTGNYPAMIDTPNIKDPSAHDEDNKETFHHSRDYPNQRMVACGRYTWNSVISEHLNLKQEDAEPKPSPDYTLHVEMYALSDQYDIPALGVLARAKLEATCQLNWNSTSFLEIIPRVYETTLESNQGLRTVVLEQARKHSNDFMKDDLLKGSFQSVLAATPEFGTALLNNYMTLNHSMTSSTAPVVEAGVCTDCGERKNAWHHDCQSVDRNAREEAMPERISAWFP